MLFQVERWGLTDGLSGGRMDGTCVGEQLNYRAASLRADAERPSAGAGVGQLGNEPSQPPTL